MISSSIRLLCSYRFITMGSYLSALFVSKSAVEPSGSAQMPNLGIRCIGAVTRFLNYQHSRRSPSVISCNGSPQAALFPLGGRRELANIPLAALISGQSAAAANSPRVAVPGVIIEVPIACIPGDWYFNLTFVG
jgi:hypothetical protein